MTQKKTPKHQALPSYLEAKIEFLVKSAKIYCVDPGTPGDIRQVIALDILDLTGKIFARTDLQTLKSSGNLLSVFPLLKKDAEGVFLEKLQSMEDACLSIQVALKQTP